MTQQWRDTPTIVWVAGGLVVVGLVMFFGVLFVPITVDAVAYLAGDGGQGTFTATSTSTNCSYNGNYGWTCSPTTYGYLDPGHIAASWAGQVHGSFPVRRPVWNPWPGLLNAPLFTQGSAILYAFGLGGVQLAMYGAAPFLARRGYRAWRSARKGCTRGRPAAA